jgi:hypothetical protein
MTTRWIPTSASHSSSQLDEEARRSVTQPVADPSPEHRPRLSAGEVVSDDDAEIESVRKIGSVFTWLFFAWCLYRTTTVPMDAMAEPLMLTIAVGVGAFLVWPRRKKVEADRGQARSGTGPARDSHARHTSHK